MGALGDGGGPHPGYPDDGKNLIANSSGRILRRCTECLLSQRYEVKCDPCCGNIPEHGNMFREMQLGAVHLHALNALTYTIRIHTLSYVSM